MHKVFYMYRDILPILGEKEYSFLIPLSFTYGSFGPSITVPLPY